jgi:hypothetical protein
MSATDTAEGTDDGACDVCVAGEVQCDAVDSTILNSCIEGGSCTSWVPLDCTAMTGDEDAFCDSAVAPAACAVPTPCSVENPMVTFTPPNLVMILDHSGSMSNSLPGGVSRWDGLTQVVDQVTANYEDRVKFGVKWFPSAPTSCTAPANCDVNPAFDVAPALFNHNAIMAALPVGDPSSSCLTPTQQGFTQTYLALSSAVPTGETGAMMLVIDGGISTSCSGNTQAGAVSNISGAFNAGFPTYVVAIDASASTAADADVYATAGGVPNPDPAFDYYPGDDLGSLNAALDAIVGQLATCDIELSMAPQYPGETEVFVDGVEYFQIDPAVCDTTDGWYYADAPTNMQITLCGGACTSFQMVLAADVNFYCGAD